MKISTKNEWEQKVSVNWILSSEYILYKDKNFSVYYLIGDVEHKHMRMYMLFSLIILCY